MANQSKSYIVKFFLNRLTNLLNINLIKVVKKYLIPNQSYNSNYYYFKLKKIFSINRKSFLIYYLITFSFLGLN